MMIDELRDNVDTLKQDTLQALEVLHQAKASEAIERLSKEGIYVGMTVVIKKDGADNPETKPVAYMGAKARESDMWNQYFEQQVDYLFMKIKKDGKPSKVSASLWLTETSRFTIREVK